MVTSPIIASLYFVCGIIIFMLAVSILRHSRRSIVNWSTALVLFFAGFGPILGAMGVLLSANPKEGTYLFQNLVASFDYIWEFFFPSLVLFALVHPKRHWLWEHIKRYIVILFLPHLFHLIMMIFLVDRVDPARLFSWLNELSGSAGVFATMIRSLAAALTVFTELLFKAHMQLFSPVNLAYAVFSVVLLWGTMRSDLTPRVRRQMRVVIAGLGMCIVTYSWARLIPIIARLNMPQDVSTAFINASLIIGGGSIAFAIVRYQFLDMRLIVRRGILYSAIVAIFATVYFIAVRRVTGFLYQFAGEGANPEILETGFIILFIIAFQPVLNRLDDWTERIIGREGSAPRVRLRNLSAELLSMVDIDGLKSRLREELGKVFSTNEVKLILAEEVLARKDDDIYAEKVIEVLSHIGEPIGRLDFMETMGFLTQRSRLFLRPARKVIREAVETLPGIVRDFAHYELIIPIIHEGACTAMLLMGSRRGYGRYNTEEQALLSMLASQIAASLSKIELLEEVVDKKVIEEELNLARTIQLNLLPSVSPRLDRYEVSGLSIASKQVGGDYYDFINRGSLLSIAVADVAGKGVPGSLLMASLQASLRTMLDVMENPIEVVGRVNDVMCEITAPDKFATLFYGCLDIKRDELRYTNAGHTFPMVLRSDGEVEVLDYSGLLLGVKERFIYEDHKLKFRPGDTLIITTDGVTEAEGGNGHLYGEVRFFELLPDLIGLGAAEVKDAIVKDVNRFSHPIGSRDDLTILVLKRFE